MKGTIIVFIFVISSLWVVKCDNTPNTPCEAHLWPLPMTYTKASADPSNVVKINQVDFDVVIVDEEELQKVDMETAVLVTKIIERYENLFFKLPNLKNFDTTEEFNNKKRDANLQYLNIKFDIPVSDLKEFSNKLIPELNETYGLKINKGDSAATLGTSSIQGLIYGLETFSQLIMYANEYIYPGFCSGYEQGFFIGQLPINIKDSPRFKWRGLLVDCTRNFLPIGTLKRIVDALSYSKMNRLHLHLTDSQSFPILFSPPIDVLAKKGAYSPREVYTADDLIELQEYARERGVIIVPEIDSPGHAYSWAYSFPETIACGAASPWGSFCNEPPCGQVDPSKDETYELLNEMFHQLYDIFKGTSPYMHLGYDEVNGNCWTTTPNIAQFSSSQGLTSINQLLQYYLTRHLANIPSEAVPIFWEEVYNTRMNIPDNAIIQIWGDVSGFTSLLQSSYKNPAILSNHDPWYLDCGMGSWLGPGGSWCSYRNWAEMYLNEPLRSIPSPTADQLRRAYGGEACLWGEQTDQYNVFQMAFPRTWAVGERLWSQKTVNSVSDAYHRLESFRTRNIERDIPSAPLQPRWCQYNPGKC